MSRTAIAILATSVSLLIAAPALAGDAKVNIIYPPQRDVEVATEAQPAKVINQTVTVAVVTVARPVFARRDQWIYSNGFSNWTGYGLRGGTQIYSGPRYPF